MKFGTKVLVTRGSAGIKSGPGVLRTVKATLIGAYGDTRIVRLDQNDPLTMFGCFLKGDHGSFGKSAVVAA